MHRWWRAIVGAVAAFLPAAAAVWREATRRGPMLQTSWTDLAPVVGVVAVAVVALAAGWPRAARVPGRLSAGVVLAVVGLAGVAVAAVAPDSVAVPLVIGVLALGFLVVFVREMARPAPRPGLVVSAGAMSAGVAGVVALSLWPWVLDAPVGVVLALIGGVAVAVCWIALTAAGGGALGETLAGSAVAAWVARCLIVLLAAIGGLGGSVLGGRVLWWLGDFDAGVTWWGGALIGLAVGCVMAVLSPVVRRRTAPRWSLVDLAWLALPLAVAAVPCWVMSLAS
ncbi:MAG: hypothetical protein LBM66_01585 [Bifidobacteriaceae bacterium]|jgi:hypothetical protein|nr:hypothetical protein [Bifidobacteriaceae bacterium]